MVHSHWQTNCRSTMAANRSCICQCRAVKNRSCIRDLISNISHRFYSARFFKFCQYKADSILDSKFKSYLKWTVLFFRQFHAINYQHARYHPHHSGQCFIFVTTRRIHPSTIHSFIVVFVVIISHNWFAFPLSYQFIPFQGIRFVHGRHHFPFRDKSKSIVVAISMDWGNGNGWKGMQK